MQFPANTLIDIFTEADETIFSDGSLDPLGLRIIWTSLGERIFGNRLNTISNNIKLYTFNLFHHHLIRELEKKKPEYFRRAMGQGPYGREDDIREGLVIFLECLQAHVVLNTREDYQHDEQAFVPGMSKLAGLSRTRANDPMVTKIVANRNGGILVRQLGLGIHGRHKGPFTEMGIFSENIYYQDEQLWDEVNRIFGVIPAWASLEKQLAAVFATLFNKTVGKDGLELDTTSVLVSAELAESYHNCFESSVYQHEELTGFWEDKLGLHRGSAKAIYDAVKTSPNENCAILLRNSLQAAQPDIAQIEAILAIEPFLTMLNKIMLRLLQRGTYAVDEELAQFIDHWLEQDLLRANDPYISEAYLSPAACVRLRKLTEICSTYLHTKNAAGFTGMLLDYHGEIVRKRGNLAWVSYDDGRIRQHRSNLYAPGYQQYLSDNEWVNTYYVPSLQNIYKGLYPQT